MKTSIAVVAGVALVVIVVAAIGGAYYFGMLGGGSQGTVTLMMKDPPMMGPYSSDVQSINITFNQISMHMTNNDSWITLTSGQPMTMDLMQIINSSKTLGTFKVPVGSYDQIRFDAATATAMMGGHMSNLQIPSGSETGLKVHFTTALTLNSSSSANILVDISCDDSGIHNGMLVPSMTATFTSSG